jgi:hypothetical protein
LANVCGTPRGGEHCLSGGCPSELVAELEGQFAVEDEEQLVEGGVHVKRRAVEPGREGLVDEPEVTVGLLAGQDHGDRVDPGREGCLLGGHCVRDQPLIGT